MISKTSSPVEIARTFNAAPETVFNAWITPDIMRRWMFVSPTNAITHVWVDPRPGGSFSILERGGDDQIDHYGEYLAVDRPRRLVFTLEVPKHFPGVTTVSVDLVPTPKGCAMRFNQEGVDKEVTEGPWRDMFDTLVEVLRDTT